MKKYKYLLFDADNTLFDFNKAEKYAFLSVRAVCPAAFGEDTYHIYHAANDRMWKRLERGEITKEKLRSERFREYLSECRISFDEELIATITEYYPKSLGKCSFLLEDAYEVVCNLSCDYEIYIITNGLKDVQTARFSSSPIRKFIKNVFISEEVGYDKPDVRYFRTVIDAVGDPDTSKYLVIGDSLTSDIDGANAAGLDSVYFTPSGKEIGGRVVNFRISRLTELYGIL